MREHITFSIVFLTLDSHDPLKKGQPREEDRTTKNRRAVAPRLGVSPELS